MPPRKRSSQTTARPEQQAAPSAAEASAPEKSAVVSEEDIADETSDSECETDEVSRQVGRDAARGTLGARSREHYTKYQAAMVSWAQKQNAGLPAEKRFKTHVPFSYRFVATYLDYLKQKVVPWPHQPGFTKHYSTGLINAVITSIKDAYRIEEVPVQEEVDTLMSNFYKMYCNSLDLKSCMGDILSKLAAAPFQLRLLN